MKTTCLRLFAFVSTLFVTLSATGLTAFAANPSTGDDRGTKLLIAMGVLAVSALVIVLLVAMGPGKKKK